MTNRYEPLNVQRRISEDSSTHGRGVVEPVLAVVLILLSSPLMIISAALALLQKQPVTVTSPERDCLERNYNSLRFSQGPFKGLAMLFAIASNKIRFVGMPMSLTLTSTQKRQLSRFQHIVPGCFNAVDVARASGLVTDSPVHLLEKQFSLGFMGTLFLFFRGLFNQLCYGHADHGLATPNDFSLFGLTVHNHSMASAIEWVLSDNQPGNGCKTGCFVNVNSINLMGGHAQLGDAINTMHRCFPDGAGIRLAAKTLDVNIKENVNGTDMLPLLCQAASERGQSIYLLGSAPGVASKAAHNLQQQYPCLNIAGTHHGFFGSESTQQVVDGINASRADIILVAMGSPTQEQWLVDNAPQLNCKTALAVGGLFDFYSGNIARAPLWMRELGMEWVWRLLQEPKNKFRRYVLGNPYFLIQIYLFNRASKGW